MYPRLLPFVFSVFFSCYALTGKAETLSSNSHHTQFDNALACQTSADKPGIVARVDHRGKAVYRGAVGVKNVETQEPLNVDDQFQLGSLTKQFTAAAILTLSEKGKLSLEDSLEKYIPGVKRRQRRITIAQLLSHTAGLNDYFAYRKITRNWHNPASVKDVIKAVQRVSSFSAPGEAHRYSNVGYLYLGRIIEIVSGKSYAAYLEEKFFIPLKLTNTYVKESGGNLNDVLGYSYDNDKLVEAEVVDRSWIYAAGAIVSTLDDLSQWHQALLNGQVISAASYQLMTSKAKVRSGESVNYGQGFHIYPIASLVAYSHEGQVPGYLTFMAYFPEHDLFASAFSNNDRQHPGPALLNMIAIQLGLSPKVLTSDSANQMDKLSGKYQFEADYVLEIFEENGNYFATSRDFERRTVIPRENLAFSWECTEDYYQLREVNGSPHLVPVSLYSGEGKAGVRL